MFGSEDIARYYRLAVRRVNLVRLTSVVSLGGFFQGYAISLGSRSQIDTVVQSPLADA